MALSLCVVRPGGSGRVTVAYVAGDVGYRELRTWHKASPGTGLHYAETESGSATSQGFTNYMEEKMKLDFEQRQRANALVAEVQDDVDLAAEEIIGLRDLLEKLYRASSGFAIMREDQASPDELVVGHIRGTIIHAGELRQLNEALRAVEEAKED
jgi:hypothetical protein